MYTTCHGWAASRGVKRVHARRAIPAIAMAHPAMGDFRLPSATEEISLEEARRIAEAVGEPVPPPDGAAASEGPTPPYSA